MPVGRRESVRTLNPIASANLTAHEQSEPLAGIESAAQNRWNCAVGLQDCAVFADYDVCALTVADAQNVVGIWCQTGGRPDLSIRISEKSSNIRRATKVPLAKIMSKIEALMPNGWLVQLIPSVEVRMYVFG